MRQAYIYVLHFDDGLSHAHHYVGCTHDITRRLAAHATGAGSNLCRVLLEKGITWKLGALGLCNHATMRREERKLKDQKNAARFCEICTGGFATRIPNTTPFSLEAIPFKTDSVSCASLVSVGKDVSIRFTHPQEPNSTMMGILELMCQDRDALGFIPAGGAEGLQQLHDRGRIAVAEAGGEIVGYCAFTVARALGIVNIQQCCVRDDARLYGIGKGLVNRVGLLSETNVMRAKVRDDLAANEFWTSIGFMWKDQHEHETSGSTINTYENIVKELP